MSWIFLFCAVLLDVIANVALKRAAGFQHKSWGIAALFCIALAFFCLAQALRSMELSFAYALWGALGLCLTIFIDAVFFNQKLEFIGWLGVSIIIVGILLLHLFA